MRQCKRCTHWNSNCGCTLLDLEPCTFIERPSRDCGVAMIIVTAMVILYILAAIIYTIYVSVQ